MNKSKRLQANILRESMATDLAACQKKVQQLERVAETERELKSNLMLHNIGLALCLANLEQENKQLRSCLEQIRDNATLVLTQQPGAEQKVLYEINHFARRVLNDTAPSSLPSDSR